MTRQTPAYDPHWPFVTSSSCCRHAVIMSSVYRRRDVAYRRHFVAMLSSGPNHRHNPPVTLAFTRKPGAHVFIEFSCNVIIYINLYYKLIHINLLIRLIINCPSHQKWASANINGKPLFLNFFGVWPNVTLLLLAAKDRERLLEIPESFRTYCDYLRILLGI